MSIEVNWITSGADSFERDVARIESGLNRVGRAMDRQATRAFDLRGRLSSFGKAQIQNFFKQNVSSFAAGAVGGLATGGGFNAESAGRSFAGLGGLAGGTWAGAKIGAAFGPVGAGVGALVGGAVGQGLGEGIFSGLTLDEEKQKKELDERMKAEGTYIDEDPSKAQILSPYKQANREETLYTENRYKDLARANVFSGIVEKTLRAKDAFFDWRDEFRYDFGLTDYNPRTQNSMNQIWEINPMEKSYDRRRRANVEVISTSINKLINNRRALRVPVEVTF